MTLLPGRIVAPGAALGVLGSGQLGRMFAIAARRMGYRVHTFSPEEDTPTGQVADVEVTASYEDLDALRAFAGQVAVVTFEFENVPIEAIDAIETLAPVRPSGMALHTAQQRAREKTFLADRGIPTVPFAAAATLDELWEGVARIGTPALIKTAAFGYDGKGQHRVSSEADVEHIWSAIGHQEALVEKFIDLQSEISIVAARGLDGEIVEYPPFENRHRHHILDLTTAPAAVPPAIARRASEIAAAILEELQYVGVLCVEFFLGTDGGLYVNELAPRPHNSGHLTIDAAVTSQFEQQVRAVCGLPLGATELLRPAAMANLLGDLWAGGEPNWAAACRFTDV
ncbi:MAG TPA: 5-(carboxyamino)imidazole ribonucleotide synthase, partial [Candidatus Limnocylindria bacterium]|nr:5-(carboxyamino)imidazole ribonucleotide synthase [Candidatus Limnocylindria bacterium]